ncbi:SDR family oxidoreductase [Baekduia soli]|uniref:SDR family oxidoreductase n=1 Tax=Baekduia soli TaxID=496014 RepID=A0A5B8U0M6_9ACTN|nr:SDR family oxidoreductase [Baekduia soli]QEC46405.1 SDR family oxidoreductase [Baekduia soli]
MTKHTRPEVVVVTGASGGVGRAIAHAFAKRGAHIALLARGEQGLAEAVAEVQGLGGKAIAVPTDVADHEAVEAAAARVEQELGPIDVWINDAMATVFARVADTDPAEFRRATEVTYLGTVYGTMAALSRMVERNSGTIVQVGSALSYRAIPLQAAYCGSKFAIRGFTDSLRTELLHDKSNVHITMVQLPGVNTTQFNWCRSKLPQHPMPVPPIYQPEIPAEAVYWAAHHRRRELWVGYSAVQAILGNKLAPSLADRYLARTGFSGQQMKNHPVDPDRPDNLYAPVQNEAATHGIFNAQAKTTSPQLWAATHRPIVAAAGLAISALAAAARRTR